MSNQLSDRILNLSPSATFAMSLKCEEMKADGIDVINLSVGEPDFNTPECIKDAARTAIDDNWSKYSPVSGYKALKKAICEKLRRENGLHYLPEEIVVSNGAKQSICNTVFALVNPGDEVIIPAPYWVSYPQMVKLAGGVPVFIETSIKNDFKIAPEQLEKAITPRTKLIILCSPCNPTGAVYSREELESFAEIVIQHPSLFVVSDEVYEHINYVGAHASMAAVPGMKERTILVNGVSKAYAMTGWRIGFLAAPKWIADACGSLQGQYTSGPSSLSQKAAESAWLGDQSFVEQMRQAFQRRRDLIVGLMREIPGVEVNEPQGAFYLFPSFASYLGKSFKGKLIENSYDLAMFLLEQGHVAAVAGDAFGGPGCIRISYATSEENIVEAVRRIREALAALAIS